MKCFYCCKNYNKSDEDASTVVTVLMLLLSALVRVF